MHPCIIFHSGIKYNYKIKVNNYKICTLFLIYCYFYRVKKLLVKQKQVWQVGGPFSGVNLNNHTL